MKEKKKSTVIIPIIVIISILTFFSLLQVISIFINDIEHFITFKLNFDLITHPILFLILIIGGIIFIIGLIIKINWTKYIGISICILYILQRINEFIIIKFIQKSEYSKVGINFPIFLIAIIWVLYQLIFDKNLKEYFIKENVSTTDNIG